MRMIRDRLMTADSPRPDPLPFKKMRGNGYEDDYEDEYGLWRHEFPVMAEGPIWLYISMYEWPSDARDEHGHKWGADLIGVSAFFASDNAIIGALESTGDYIEEAWDDLDDAKKEMAICEALIDVGTKMTLCTKTSTRAKGPFKGCAVEAVVATGLWGFFADRAQNRMGDSGWDFMKGEFSWGRQQPRTPNEFQAKVIAWLNTYYEDRHGFHHGGE